MSLHAASLHWNRHSVVTGVQQVHRPRFSAPGRFQFSQYFHFGFSVYCFLCLCVCVFVRLRISPPRIELAMSNFARQFIGVQRRKSPFFVKFAFPKAQNRTNRDRPMYLAITIASIIQVCIKGNVRLHRSSNKVKASHRMGRNSLYYNGKLKALLNPFLHAAHILYNSCSNATAHNHKKTLCCWIEWMNEWKCNGLYFTAGDNFQK